jgi:hypothetical protein
VRKNQKNLGVTEMKKWMTLAFASILAITLSMPAWSQSTTGAKAQTTTTQKEKDAKKEAAKKKKADKKAADKKAKEDAAAAKKNASKK